MPEPVFEIFEDSQGKYRFRLRAPNKEIIAASQGYSSKQGCMTGIDSVKENASKADVVEKDEDKIKLWEEGTSKAPEADRASGVLFLVAMLLIILAILMMFL